MNNPENSDDMKNLSATPVSTISDPFCDVPVSIIREDDQINALNSFNDDFFYGVSMNQFNGNAVNQINDNAFKQSYGNAISQSNGHAMFNEDTMMLTSYGEYMAALMAPFHVPDRVPGFRTEDAYSCFGNMTMSSVHPDYDPRFFNGLHLLQRRSPTNEPSSSTRMPFTATLPVFNSTLISLIDLVAGIWNGGAATEFQVNAAERAESQHAFSVMKDISSSSATFGSWRDPILPEGVYEDCDAKTNMRCSLKTHSNNFMSHGKGEEEQVLIIHIKCDGTCPPDGYAWRKYGQKDIKGTKHPKSYFKCAEAGCSIRKYVQLSSETDSCIQVTYIGRHNH